MAQNEPIKPVEQLSARALGVYLYMASIGSYQTADELAEVFKEGRDAMQTTLKELRDRGLITTKKIRTKAGKIITSSELMAPETANRTLEIPLLLLLNKYRAINNIYNKLKAINGSSKQLYNWKNRSADADTQTEEQYGVVNFPIGGDVDDRDYYEDQAREKELWKRERQEEFDSKKKKAHEKVRATGKNVPGCVAEFASRVNSLWGVKEWSQDRVAFRIAYAEARLTHATDGDIEFAMMDLFFNSQSYIGTINDPDHIWRRFITMFGPLSIQVKNTILDDDKVRREEEREARSMEKLFDV